MIGKLVIAIIIGVIIAIYFKGDSIWYYVPSESGISASLKMSGTVSITSDNFGGFYKGFPSPPDDLKSDDNW